MRAIREVHDLIRTVQRCDVKGLRLPLIIRHRAIAEACHKAAVADVVGIAAVEFGAEAEILLPVHEAHGIGDRALRFELHHARIERGIRHRIDSHEHTVHIEFKVVVAKDVTRDDLAIGIDDFGWQVGDGGLCCRDVCRRDAVVFIVEVGRFRRGGELRGRRHRPTGVVGSRDRTDATDPLPSWEEIGRHRRRAPLRDRSRRDGAHSKDRITRQGLRLITNDALRVARRAVGRGHRVIDSGLEEPGFCRVALQRSR